MAGILYHGSVEPMEVGTVLVGRGASCGDDETEARLEAMRPDGMIARGEALFLAFAEDDIDALGGYVDSVMVVETDGPVERSDLAWATACQIALETGDMVRADACAAAYWAGTPFEDPARSVFEARTRRGLVTACLDEASTPAF